jgi:hypothetical protein
MGLFDWLGGESEPTITQVSRLNKTQQKIADVGGASILEELESGGPADPLGGDAGLALQRLLSGDPSSEITPDSINAFFESAIEAPARRTFQERTLPGIRGAFRGPGFFGSAAGRAQAAGSERRDEGLEAIRATLLQSGAQESRQLKEAAMGRSLAALPAGIDDWRRQQRPIDPAAVEDAFRFLGIPMTHTVVSDPMQGAMGPLASTLTSLFAGGGGGKDGGGGLDIGALLSKSVQDVGGDGFGGDMYSKNVGAPGFPGRDNYGFGGSGMLFSGDTEQNTQQALQFAANAAMMAMFAGCWVAEEIWGVNHPKVWAARAWCAVSSRSLFTRLYQRHGIKWAAMVRKYPVLRIITRPIWSLMAMRGRQILNRWRRKNGTN